MRRVLFFLVVLFALALIFAQPGCWFGKDRNPAAQQVQQEAQSVLTVESVSFRFVLPDKKPPLAVKGDSPPDEAAPEPAIMALAGATPTVTFKLILVNVGNTTNPTTTLSKTVLVNSSGSAQASFESIPAFTCIGDIHIENGRYGGYSDFHGATDLLPGAQNFIEVAPKNSRLDPDIVAFVIESVLSDSGLLYKIEAGLVVKVRSALVNLNMTSPTLLDDAVALFAAYVKPATDVLTAAPVQLTGQDIGPGGGTLAVSSSTSQVDGMLVTVPPGMLEQTAKVTVSTAQIASFSLGTNVTPATPLIMVENLVATGSQAVTLTVPVSKNPGEFAMAYYYDAATGKLEGIPPIEVTDQALLVEVPQLGRPSTTVSPGIRFQIGGEKKSGVVVVKQSAASLLPTWETGFKPGVDDWQFENQGSYYAQGGACDGMSVTAVWYFLEKRRKGEPRLNGRYDNDTPWRPGSHKTPDLGYDDTRAIRFVADNHKFWATFGWDRFLGAFSDEYTYNCFLSAMVLTNEPQVMAIMGKNGMERRQAI